MYNSQYTYSNPYYNQFIPNDTKQQPIQPIQNQQNNQQINSMNDLFDKEDEYSVPPSFNDSTNTNQVNQQQSNETYVVPSTIGYTPFPTFARNQPKEFNIGSSYKIPISNISNNQQQMNQMKQINKQINNDMIQIQQLNRNEQELLQSVPIMKGDDLVLIQSNNNNKQEMEIQSTEMIDSDTVLINGNGNNNNQENDSIDNDINTTDDIQQITIQELNPTEYVNDEANIVIMKKLMLVALLFYPIYLLLTMLFKGSNDKKIKRNVFISTTLFIIGVIITLLIFILISFDIL